MGFWGAGLYDNDCTLDIITTYQKLLESGFQPRQAKLQLERDFCDVFADPEDGDIAKVALADQLWSSGALEDGERQAVLDYLRNGGDIAMWQECEPALLLARKEELKRLEAQFTVPIKAKKKKALRVKKRLDWKVGEVYAIPLSRSYDNIFNGKTEYILLYVFSEGDVVKGYKAPIVWAKLTQNGILPKNADEFNALDYVQIECTAFEDRYRPFKSEHDLPPEYKQEYFPDSWGYLPEFSFEVLESRGNHPPESIIFLGCFGGILPPRYNFRRYRSGLCTAWKYLEDYVIERYQLHNLRKAQFYQ